jgi:hypothetical protein
MTSVLHVCSLHDLSELSSVSKLSRKEEKENMQGLNNRLAGYIDKVAIKYILAASSFRNIKNNSVFS